MTKKATGNRTWLTSASQRAGADFIGSVREQLNDYKLKPEELQCSCYTLNWIITLLMAYDEQISQIAREYRGEE